MIAALIANTRPARRGGRGRDAQSRGRLLGDRARGRQAVAFRDPHGFRPLVLGRLDDEWVVASETCALDLVGAEFERERPGELLVVDEHGLRAGRRSAAAARSASSSSSTSRGPTRGSTASRCTPRACGWASGSPRRRRSRPTSCSRSRLGTPAAIGFSRATGIPFSEGLIKNRYVGRTFIQPDQALRQQGIRLKFNPLAEVAGQRVVVVDDSIVRGNTTRQIVSMLFDAGATEVHVRVSSPPVVGPCFYGIDLADEDELIASSRTVEEVRASIGATSLAYLSLEGLSRRRAARVGALPRLPHGRRTRRGSPTDRRLAKQRFEPARA